MHFKYLKTIVLLLIVNISFSNELNKFTDSPLLASYSITVTASSSSDYTLSGTDFNGAVSGADPNLTFYVGDVITFAVNASGHPFYLKTVAGTGTGDQISGVTNNGTESGNVVWTPSAAGTYYYQCSVHSGMVGTITVLTIPSVSSIVLDEAIINETGAASTLTATISAAYSKDVTIPLTVTGTADSNDYSTAFTTKGLSIVAGANSNGNALNQLYSPYDVVTDSSGNIYVADRSNSRIVKWAPGASEGVVIISSVSASSLHLDGSGNIYVASGSDVIKYTFSGGSYSASTVAGGNGQGAALNQLSNPQGIDVDSSGNIYIADQSNHRIMKWAPDDVVGVIVAGGNNYGNELNQLYNPWDVTVDSSGNVFVADHNNHRVMKWAPSATEGVDVSGGNFYYPSGIDMDSLGNIYVSQYHYHTVTKYTVSGSTYSGSVIIGTYSNSGNSLTKIYYPRGVHVDSSGNVYVADANNHRVLKLQVSPEITIAAGATTGTAIFTSLSDFDDEDDETIIITPSTSPTNATSSISSASTVTITDNDDPPSVSFAFSFPSIEENSSTDVTLTATLNRVSGKSIQIPYTVGGTATETTEFTVSSSPLINSCRVNNWNVNYIHQRIRRYSC